MTECYAVVTQHWEGVDVKKVFVSRMLAEKHCAELNGGPYDPDDFQEYRVYTYPFTCSDRRCLANPE